MIVFDLKGIIKQFNVSYFFETGTWKGDGVAYAARYPFKRLYSSEVVKEFAVQARERFASDGRVQILHQDSVSALKSKLPEIDGNCVFWLDAHYPAADEGIKDYNDELDEHIRLPLEVEVNLISKRIEKYNDVLLIDDLRIYEDGPYQYGNISSQIIPPKNRNVEFVNKLYGKTHNILRSYKGEGYLMVVPKSAKSPDVFSKIRRVIQRKIL